MKGLDVEQYYELKKKQGLIFTRSDIDPSLPCEAIDKKSGEPIEMPYGPLYWSRLSGRYRNSAEQKKYIVSGCVDRRLPTRTNEL